MLYRKSDLEKLAEQLRGTRHSIDLQFSPDAGAADFFVDYPPYGHGAHLKLLFEGYVVTAFGLIIEKAS